MDLGVTAQHGVDAGGTVDYRRALRPASYTAALAVILFSILYLVEGNLIWFGVAAGVLVSWVLLVVACRISAQSGRVQGGDNV